MLLKIFNNLFIMTCLLCHVHSVSDRKRPVELKYYVFIIFQYLLNNENATTKIMKVDLVKGKVNPRENAKVHLNERIFFLCITYILTYELIFNCRRDSRHNRSSNIRRWAYQRTPKSERRGVGRSECR